MVGRRFADRVPAWEEAPVIHPVARGGPECRAVLGGSIKRAAVLLEWEEEARHRSELARACTSRRCGECKSGVSWRWSCGVRQLVVVVVDGGLVFEAADLAVAQPVVAEGEDLAGDSDLRDVAPSAFGDPLELGAQRSAAGGDLLRGFGQRPAQRGRALAGDVPQARPAVGAADGRRQPRPRAQMPGRREACDVADLGDDQHRRVAPNPADLTEHSDALVGLRASVDLAGGGGDLAVEVSDQRQQAVQPLARPVGQLERCEELLSAFAEQVGVLGQDAVAGQQRVHAVLDGGADSGQRRAVAKQLAQVTQRGRGDVRLGEQPGAQQMRERLGVDRVGLHAGGGDRPGAQRMREMHVIAGLLEQLREPLPAVGRLERDVRSLRVAEQLQECLAVVDDPAREHKLSMLVDDRDLRAPAVQVDADPARRVTHGRSSSRIVRPRGRTPRGLNACSSGRRADLLRPLAHEVRGAGAPALHDIKCKALGVAQLPPREAVWRSPRCRQGMPLRGSRALGPVGPSLTAAAARAVMQRGGAGRVVRRGRRRRGRGSCAGR